MSYKTAQKPMMTCPVSHERHLVFLRRWHPLILFLRLWIEHLKLLWESLLRVVLEDGSCDDPQAEEHHEQENDSLVYWGFLLVIILFFAGLLILLLSHQPTTFIVLCFLAPAFLSHQRLNYKFKLLVSKSV